MQLNSKMYHGDFKESDNFVFEAACFIIKSHASVCWEKRKGLLTWLITEPWMAYCLLEQSSGVTCMSIWAFEQSCHLMNDVWLQSALVSKHNYLKHRQMFAVEDARPTNKIGLSHKKDSCLLHCYTCLCLLVIMCACVTKLAHIWKVQISSQMVH